MDIRSIGPALLEMRALAEVAFASRGPSETCVLVRLCCARLLLAQPRTRSQGVRRSPNLPAVGQGHGRALLRAEHHDGVVRLEVAGDDAESGEVPVQWGVRNGLDARLQGSLPIGVLVNQLRLAPAALQQGDHPAVVLGHPAHEALVNLRAVAAPTVETGVMHVRDLLAPTVRGQDDEFATGVRDVLDKLGKREGVGGGLGCRRPQLVLVLASHLRVRGEGLGQVHLDGVLRPIFLALVAQADAGEIRALHGDLGRGEVLLRNLEDEVLVAAVRIQVRGVLAVADHLALPVLDAEGAGLRDLVELRALQNLYPVGELVRTAHPEVSLSLGVVDPDDNDLFQLADAFIDLEDLLDALERVVLERLAVDLDAGLFAGVVVSRIQL
mmetsp:Transcript_123012/g.353398  ORF Transcript_123012/g.353398 Transcript_123012/m.353398 type:complete len:383 (+) Transcript_123012:3034-4182(+)